MHIHIKRGSALLQSSGADVLVMFDSPGCDKASWGLLFLTFSPAAFLWCLTARSRSVIPGEGVPSLGSPRSSRSMERPLKAGWLKKQQRSLVKNWQQRYFVLRGSTLTYHKDDKETTVQVRHWETGSMLLFYSSCSFFCWRNTPAHFLLRTNSFKRHISQK